MPENKLSEAEIAEKHFGFSYRVVPLRSMGHRCGYVEIPEGHPLYGFSYGDHCDWLKPLWDGAEDCKEISIEGVFDVHGGITYSGEGKGYLSEEESWWIGFDCGHSGDAKDLNIMDQKTLKTEVEMRQGGLGCFEGYQIRNAAYVAAHCMKLIDQILRCAELNSKLPPTPLERMRELAALPENERDEEAEHIKADDLLCELLLSHGEGEIVGLFNELPKWYS